MYLYYQYLYACLPISTLFKLTNSEKKNVVMQYTAPAKSQSLASLVQK